MDKKTTVVLKKGEGRTIKSGGAWIFDNEIATIEGTFKNGSLVFVEDFDGYPMGCGYINQNSKIRVRMLSRKPDQTVDEHFIYMRMKSAWEYRKRVMLHEQDLRCCRVVFGEADFLPGMTIDRYEDVLVAEALTLGVEQALIDCADGVQKRLKRVMIEQLLKVLREDGVSIRAVYERNDAKERQKEGLNREKGLFWLDEVGFLEDVPDARRLQLDEQFDPHIEINENGVRYLVDVKDGQKTGFFLDQKYNRLAMQRICRGMEHLKVLDCFTHMGTFALNCGLAGADDVTGLDISGFAVQQATENAKRNGLSETVHFREANVLEELPRLLAQGESYDVVILDPPAFTKSREATKNAIKGYREINIKGLKLVRDGGYFATCSCSHFMTQELLAKTVKEAAKAAHKRLRQIEFRTQACDHPILWSSASNTPESYYLKFLIFQVVEEA